MYNDAAFRAQFPEFADPAMYPAATIGLFYTLAATFVKGGNSPCSFLQGDQYIAVLNYLTAHLMVLSRQQNSATNGGQEAGTDQGGFIQSSSIGEISVSKLAPPAKDGWEYWLSSTPYGTALWALLSIVSIGGFSMGGMNPGGSFRQEGGVFL